MPSDLQIEHPEQLKEFLISCYDTTDSQSIVQAQLKKVRLVLKGEVDVYV